jgi:LETM1 and EF-hand domain-containing protein 1
LQVNETELEVSSDSASYKQRLEVLQQQEELIEDEQEQEAKESEARRLKKEAEEEAKEEAKREEAERKKEADEREKEKVGAEKEEPHEMLPEAEVSRDWALPSWDSEGGADEFTQVKEATEKVPAEPAVKVTDPADVRMTAEQVTELGQALEILSAKSSVIKERTELRKLIAENNQAEEEVCPLFFSFVR